MEDNTFWAFVWLSVAGVLMTLIAVLGYNYHESTLSNERLISQGIDPIILECADGGFKQDGAMAVFCMDALKKYKINERDISKLKKIIDGQ